MNKILAICVAMFAITNMLFAAKQWRLRCANCHSLGNKNRRVALSSTLIYQ